MWPLARAAALSLAFASLLPAQQEPIIGVEINTIRVASGSGAIIGASVTSGGAGYTTAPAVTVTGGTGTGAVITANLTGGVVTSLTVDNPGSGYTSPTITIAPPSATTATATATTAAGAVTSITVTSGGAGYTSAPTVTIGGPGTGAAATATIVDGKVTAITVTAGGTGYTSATVTISAPPTGTPATGTVTAGTIFTTPFQNESYGPYGTRILITALAHGTNPADGYSYEFYVNGVALAQPFPNPVASGVPATVSWAPPQPGAYQLTVKASDGGHTVTSLAVRYFATGTAIIGPVDNTVVPNGSSVVIQATAVPAPVGSTAFVQRMEFLIDGTLRGTDYTYPYSFIYKPETTPTAHTIEARAYDNNGVLVSAVGSATRSLRMVTPVGTPPTVTFVNPLNNAKVSAGSTINLIVDAVSTSGFVRNVDFYVNGVLHGSSQSFPFSTTWSSSTPGKYEFVAIASDDKSNAVASAPITINVAGGFPTVSIATPEPTGATVIQGTTLSVRVNAAGPDGGISSLSSIELLVDGTVSDALPKNPQNVTPPPPLSEPFDFTWRSSVALGAHTLAARVTSTSGLIVSSVEVPITVIANQLPSIDIKAPASGASGPVGTAVTLIANPSDPDGAVASVDFYINGSLIGDSVTTSPYQTTWTPTAAGSYTITAKVTDNAGASVMSDDVEFIADPESTGGATGTNIVYRGVYSSTSEQGSFVFAINKAGRGTFVGSSTNPVGRLYYWNDFAVSNDGSFSVVDANKNVLVSGQTSATGVSGTFGDRTFIGPITLGTYAPLFYTSTLSGGTGGTVVAMFGADGSISFYANSGSQSDAASGNIQASGAFTMTSPNGTTFTGTVVTASGVISGTVSGKISGSFFLSPIASRLVNISTRTTIGGGENVLIAGFTVRGTGKKPLLIRGVGPTLVNLGVTGVIANPALAVYSSASAVVASNDNWSGADVAAKAKQLGAFDLPTGSADAALLFTADSESTYTTIISGSNGTSGNGMVEIYDCEAVGTGSSRLTNISSRGYLPAGDTMFAGFVISGDVRKKLLIRAVGPTLSKLGIANPLPNPKLSVMYGQTVIASNDNWSTSVTPTTKALVYPFELMAGSKDAAIVVQLNPGLYTVLVSDADRAAGVVLVEIWDAD
ncbi:hypothetical protein DB354_17910 [Opitutus sp. ER46]|nr:hypothetical protein DB354_17910 [Opitutus sp. ER46]